MLIANKESIICGWGLSKKAIKFKLKYINWPRTFFNFKTYRRTY